MNKLIKTLLLVIYTFGIFAISIAISNGVNKKTNQRFTEYTNQSYNDDITINVQMMEYRQSPKVTETDYEYSKYDVYLFVTKKVDAKINNMYAYLCSESNNKYSYTQVSSSRSMETLYQCTTMYFLNSSTAFAYLSETEDDNGKVTVENRTPETFYIKIAYEIVYNDDQDETVYTKELNFKYDVANVDTSNFDNYENRTVGSTYIDGENDLFKLKITKGTVDATSTSPAYDRFALNILDVNSANLPSGTSVAYSELTVYGLISSDTYQESKYFSKYVRLFTYTGAMVTDRGIKTSRTVQIEKTYKVSKLYVTSKITLTDGTVHNTNYYVNVSDLLS